MTAKHTVVLVAAAAVALAGCGSVRSDRRATASDVCAVALPAGQMLAGRGARLASLQRLSQAQANSLLADLHAPPLAGPAPTTTLPAATSPPVGPTERMVTGVLCALAYKGNFRADELPSTVRPTGGNGSVLVLVVTTRHSRVVRAVVLADLPPRLR